jgi:two-component system heavy metal sensor histidine kinase CusS
LSRLSHLQAGQSARWSIAARLAWMFALVAVAIFVLMGAALFHVLERELDDARSPSCRGRMEDLRYMLEHSRSPQLAEHVKQKMQDLQDADGHHRYWLWSAEGTTAWDRVLNGTTVVAAISVTLVAAEPAGDATKWSYWAHICRLTIYALLWN